jgi:hypothetical protein
MNNHENFANWVLESAQCGVADTQYPYVYEDRDGDRVEFFLSDDDFVADRIDGRLTVYRDRESGNLVGGSIKGVTALLDRLCREFAGFAFNIRDGKIDLKVVLSAVQLQEQDEVLSMHYRTLFEKLALRGFTADMHVPNSIGEPDEAGYV